MKTSNIWCALCSLLVVIAMGCAGEYNAEYERSMSTGDYQRAKMLMRQQLEEYSLRDNNPTLAARIAQSYYHLAYAHGRLGEYDSMKIALTSSVVHDRNLVSDEEKMLDYFAVEEYNRAVSAHNRGDYRGAMKILEVALSIVNIERQSDACAAAILCGMASAASRMGDIDQAIAYCRRSAKLGDPGAAEMLNRLEIEKVLKPLDRLEPREKPPLNL